MTQKKTHEIKAKWNASEFEAGIRAEFLKNFVEAPIPDHEILQNLPLFLSRQNLSQILFVNEMYQQILDVHGVIMEFGVRWGRNMALYGSLRGIYEPFNHNRKIIGFDTFEGFPSVDRRDGNDEIISVGAYNVTENYDAYLAKVLDYHEQESPISHIKKYEIVKGDASVGINGYLKKHPETIIALAYFDFDIYQPTYDCLLAIKECLPKGAVVGFDELNDATYPGETLALKEMLGISKHKIRHSRFSPTQSYIVIE
ncbi:TylF/MycF/NovP-related O-methyltransferase [Bradyrhizobium erythrophlei]|uniref:Macrocin-O-methyltransferase (TylF) n=1 Tax=Bradyrhizobium erythrophlei TaxID=1437360 RepID=A0A1M7UHE5_9BRAD|nr:TylF/MycF/NovP-related O-methyltransferase [Bradyrhizobium erythrophlei]SHN82409.1 Macrocin-O-methyltransferase (TylF) [Bradyrhizobium erythrophlei]